MYPVSAILYFGLYSEILGATASHPVAACDSFQNKPETQRVLNMYKAPIRVELMVSLSS